MRSTTLRSTTLRSTTRLAIVISLILAQAPLGAAPSSKARPTKVRPEGWCGSHPANLEVALARHEAYQAKLERRRAAGLAPSKSAPNVFEVGHLVVLEDDGTAVTPPNDFDLKGKSVQFLRRPKGMSAVRTNLGFKQLIGDRLELGDDDSVEAPFQAGFTFPFGNQVYTSVWVNSNGNLTFNTGDPLPFPSLELLLATQPRIAALWADLDPTAATEGNGVFVHRLSGRVRVTWLNVPEFATGLLSSFQVTLFETGRIVVAYGDQVEVSVGVTGVSPFDDALRVVDYSEELPVTPPARVTIAEQFFNFFSQDELAISQTFFEHYRDVYDHVIIWLDFPGNLGGAFAFELNVSNTVRGIGLPVFDASAFFGSAGKLQSVVQMGDVAKYPDDPDAPIFTDGPFTPMAVLGHEAGHRWLAFVRVFGDDGNPSDVLLGRQLAHWSYHLNSAGSVMEGNAWTDDGAGSFTSTDRTATRYSELDQYLMGLVPSADVPDFFYIGNPSSGSPEDSPSVGDVVQGDRVDVSVEDVIDFEGTRRPASTEARKSFRTAFVLVAPPGRSVSQESLDKLETFRLRWNNWFEEATDFRGEVRTNLFPR